MKELTVDTLDFETLNVERCNEHVLLVRLSRPQALNAINTQMGRELLDLWTQLTVSSLRARCIVLTGAGERAFCVGGDLKERDGMTEEMWHAQHELFERGFLALLNCPVPVIAAVNGHAFGGGLENALACDFIYAARGARFGLSELRLGIMPGGGGTQTLSRAAGERRAKELILTARSFTPEEGCDWGIVNLVCEPEELVPQALATANDIAGNAPLATRQAKKAIHHGLQMDLESAYRFEIEAYNRLIQTEDRLEGVRAFNEKRKPIFVGR